MKPTKQITLLEKAKSARVRLHSSRKITNQHIALALAWAKGEVSYVQAQEALTGKRGGMTAYVMLARALRDHINSKKI